MAGRRSGTCRQLVDRLDRMACQPCRQVDPRPQDLRQGGQIQGHRAGPWPLRQAEGLIRETPRSGFNFPCPGRDILGAVRTDFLSNKLWSTHGRHRHRFGRPHGHRQVWWLAGQDPGHRSGCLGDPRSPGPQRPVCRSGGRSDSGPGAGRWRWPESGAPGLTINAVCGSGLKSVMLAAQAVASGDSDIVIAGGQENMSLSPHVLPGSRDGQRMGDWKMVDTMIVDGLWDVYNQYHMGITAENVAKKYGVTREQQD